MTADALRFTAQSTQAALTHLSGLAEQAAAALAAAEQRAATAEAALKRAQARLKRAPVVPEELRAAAVALLSKLGRVTTEDFALGATGAEHEALAALIAETNPVEDPAPAPAWRGWPVLIRVANVAVLRRIWDYDSETVVLCTQETFDRLEAGLGGRWPVAYPRSEVREYAIDVDGKAVFEAVWAALAVWALDGAAP